jgi:hypothetical protein
VYDLGGFQRAAFSYAVIDDDAMYARGRVVGDLDAWVFFQELRKQAREGH